MDHYLLQCMCGEKNALHAYYCVYCGKALDCCPPWAMCGFNAERSGYYPKLCGKNLPETRYEYGPTSKSIDLFDLPQTIMSYDTFWHWDLAEKKLTGIHLQPKSGKGADRLETSISIEGRLCYANSLSFDGVCINGIYDRSYFRLSMYDGKLVNRFHDNAISNTPKAAPIIVSISNPKDRYRPFRFFIAALTNHVLIVDIGTKDKEKHHLIPWDNLDGEDDIRSPVQYKNKVYFLSKRGKLFCLDVGRSFSSIIGETDCIKPLIHFKENFYYAPVVLDKHLICITINEESSKKNSKEIHSDWCQRDILNTNLEKLNDIKYFELDDYERRKTIKDSCHISPLTDGSRAYVQKNNEKGVFYRISPGKKPVKKGLKKVEGKAPFPTFSPRTSVFVGKRYLMFEEEKRQLHIYSMEKGSWIQSLFVPIGSNFSSRLYAQPTVFANLLSLLFNEQIMFMDISKRK